MRCKLNLQFYLSINLKLFLVEQNVECKMPFVMRLYCFHIKYKSTYKNVIMSLVLMRFHFHNAWIFMMCIHAVVTMMWTVLMMTTTNNYKRQCKNSTSENCVWHNFLSWTEITSMCKEFFITIFSSFISLSCHATHICMCFHLIHIWFYLLLLVMCTRKLFFKDQTFQLSPSPSTSTTTTSRKRRWL